MRSKTVDDDSEVDDDPVLHCEDNRLHGEDNRLHGEDDDYTLPLVPDILPELPDVENEEEDDVEGRGGQDSQEEKFKVSKAEATYFSMC